MKKHLALSALGLASLCSGALAQSSVTVFGLIDLSVAHEENGTSRLLASWLRQRNHALSDATAQQWSLGVLYPLSKRTALYASAAVVDNSANAAVNAGGVRGASDRVVDVGVRHAF